MSTIYDQDVDNEDEEQSFYNRTQAGAADLREKRAAVEAERHNPDVPLSDESSKLAKNSATARESLYRSNKIPEGTKVKGHKKSILKRYGTISGILFLITGGIFSFILSILPLELLHIKEVFQQEIGGIQDTVLVTRQGRIYSKMFFFDNDGAFSGFKEQGLLRIFKNRSSNKLVRDLRASGFDFEPEYLDGRWTGRFTEFTTKDGTVVNQSSSFGDRHKAAKAIVHQEALNQGKGKLWRTRKTFQLRNRLGLSYLRGDWIRDKLVFPIESAELKLRARGRNAMLTALGREPVLNSSFTLADDDGLTPEQIAQKDGAGTAFDGFDEETKKQIDLRRAELRTNNSIKRRAAKIGLSIDDAGAKAIKNGAGAALKGLAVLGAVEIGCQIKRIINTVTVTARTLRQENLARYASTWLSLSDSIVAGEPDLELIGAATTQLNTVSDREDGDGNDFFGSGYWQWASGNRGVTVNEDELARTSSSPASLGLIAEMNSFADDAINKSGASVEDVCGFVNNIFVTAGSFALGIGAAIFSGGTFTATSVVASVAASQALTVAEVFLTPILVDDIVGSFLTWEEVGDEVAGRLIPGYEVLLGANSSGFGMHPVTGPELSALSKIHEEEKLYALKQQSFVDRFFNPYNHRSIVAAAAVRLPNGTKNTSNTIASVFKNPAEFLFGSLSNFPFSRAFATVESSAQCGDQDSKDHNLVVSPSCNPVYGMSVSTLEMDVVENLEFMLAGYMDENGDPLNTEQGNLYKEYLDNCTGLTDVLHSNDGTYSSEFSTRCLDGAGLGDGTEAMAVIERFKLAALDTALLIAIGEDLDQDYPVGEGATTPQTTAGAQIVGDPYSDSTDIACAPETIDLGIHNAYVEGTEVPSRLCALPNLPSRGAESLTTSSYYVDGADGLAIVNSRVSGAWFSLIDSANKAGHNLSAASSFRRNEHQQNLWVSLGMNTQLVATPGHSPHQAAVAIDFSGMGDKNTSFVSNANCETRRSVWDSDAYRWLAENAYPLVGLKQYAAESWHFDALDNESRCE